MIRLCCFLIGVTFVFAWGAAAQVYVHESGTLETPTSLDRSGTYPEDADVERVGLYFASDFESGGGTLTLKSPDDLGGEGAEPEVLSFGTGEFNIARVYDVAGEGEQVSVEVAIGEAVGDWLYIVTAMPSDETILAFIVGGGLMAVIGALFIIGWGLWQKPKWRWFGVGALVWIVAILLKFGIGMLLNGPFLGFLDAQLPSGVYEVIGSSYVGLLTGLTEITITLLAVLLFRNVCERAVDAVALGIGAGAVEAIVLGANTVALFVMVRQDMPGLEGQTIITTALMAATPLAFLTGPVERVLAILCHVASRTLVVYAVARKRAAGFWYGFFLLSAIDVIAGYVHVAELIGEINMWWIELAILPFALLSIYIIVWCMRHWPGGEADAGGNLRKLENFPLETEG